MRANNRRTYDIYRVRVVCHVYSLIIRCREVNLEYFNKKIEHVQCMCVNEVSELCMDRHIFYFYRASIRF
jgi:hypothetical protein